MTCRGFRFWYGLPLPGSALSWFQRSLDAHASRCERCHAFTRRHEAVPMMLRRACDEEANTYTPSVPLAVLAPSLRPWRPSLRLPAAGVAFATAAIAGALTLMRPSTPQHSVNRGLNHSAQRSPRQPGQTSLPGSYGNGESSSEQSDRVGLNNPKLPSPGVAPTARIRGLTQNPERPMTDLEYLDGQDLLLTTWMLGKPDPEVLKVWRAKLPPVRDDFVEVSLPRLVSMDDRAAGDAIKQYEEEAKVVDARLFKKVTLACKAMPLDDFCAELSKQTEATIKASRGVRDEKVTVFVENRPVRDVMREVARLFGYTFGRSGAPNAYKYELIQGLRSQLAEEEMRQQDVHQALVALDEQMNSLRPLLNQNVDDLLARPELNNGEMDVVKNRLRGLVGHGGWGPAQLYFHLSPAERNELLSGKELRFGMEGAKEERFGPAGSGLSAGPLPGGRGLSETRLPAEWKDPALKASGLFLFPNGGIFNNIDPSKAPTPVAQVPGMEPEVRMRLDRSEAGEYSLSGRTSVHQSGGATSGYVMIPLGKGRSPSTANPDNARANAALKNDPLFRPRIDLTPKPSCPRLAEDAERIKSKAPSEYDLMREPVMREPHVNSADVWEEFHLRTKLPVVADSYTHLYSAQRLTYKGVITFDALCRAGDELGVRWRKDGDFILARSTAFFWDKLKEVPNRQLLKWQANRSREGGLPLEDLLEMGSLSDQQLGSRTVGLGVTHCWGLDEWGILGGGPVIEDVMIMPPDVMRRQVRTLGRLTASQLARALKPEGLLQRDLGRDAEAIADGLNWGADNRLHVEYIPRGWHVWAPTIFGNYATASRWPHVYARTREETLAMARKYDPSASLRDVRATRGQLNLIQIMSDGQRSGTGGPTFMVDLNETTR